MAYRETEATRLAKAKRRNEILHAATDIVAERGFRAASAKAIAEAAGISPGTIYTHFETRESLLTAVFEERAQHELDAVRLGIDAEAGDPVAQLRALVSTFAGRASANRTLAWALLIEPVDVGIDEARLTFRRAYTDTTEAVLAAGIALGVFPEQHARLAAGALVGAISEALVGPLSVFAPGAPGAPGAPAAPGAVHTPNEQADPRPQFIADVTTFCLRAVGTAGTHAATSATSFTALEGSPA